MKQAQVAVISKHTGTQLTAFDELSHTITALSLSVYMHRVGRVRQS